MYTTDEVFKSSVERTPDAEAVFDPDSGERYTYAELDALVGEIAAGLLQREIAPGDRVAMCLRNSLEYVLLFLAIQRIGAVGVPFNFRVSRDGLQHHLSDSDPQLFVFDDSIADLVAEHRGTLPCENLVSTVDGAVTGAEHFSALRSKSVPAEFHSPAPDDLSVILYSSGTTGKPKGIKITQSGSVSRVLLNALGQHIYNEETMIGVMPLYHTVGLHGILLSILATSGTYIPMAELDADLCARTIDRENVTVMHEAPTIFKRVLDCPAASDANFDSVDVVTFSGAPMSQELFARAKRDFDPTYLFNVYGMTEAYTPRTQLNLREGDEPRLIGGSNVLHSTRVVEVDSDDPTAEVGPGQEGELVVHMDSPCVFEGYWNRSNSASDGIIDGWYFSGDIGIKTDDGNFIITGRADNLIISGGENIHPEEIEDTLVSHPQVESAVVVGTPDEEWGEVPKAYVVTTGRVTETELDEHCLESTALADFKRPRAYEIVDQIPRNASGKKLRYKLR